MNQDFLVSLERTQHDITNLEDRDFQLWVMSLAILQALACGVALLIFPNLRFQLQALDWRSGSLLQLFVGLLVLVTLADIYLYNQRKLLKSTRQRLTAELARGVFAENASFTDPLTEVFNRRGMEEILEKEIARATRYRSALTFIMIDLNDFKAVNTNAGHLAGDKLLIDVARLLKSSVRTPDFVFRYGGDEFLLALPNTSEEQAKCVLEKIQTRVANWNLRHATPEIKMSLSCGISAFTPGANIFEVIARADKRMYAEKPSRKVDRPYEAMTPRMAPAGVLAHASGQIS